MIFSSACQVPHKPVGEKPARVAERVAAEQQKRNQSYKLVLTDEEDEDDSHEAAAKVFVSFMKIFLFFFMTTVNILLSHCYQLLYIFIC